MPLHHTIPSSTAAIAVALSVASAAAITPASAEPLAGLSSALESARGATPCAPLHTDPLVMRVTQMATQETADYRSHRSAAVPFTDPMPALQTIGYSGSKAVLLSGQGNTEADAIRGLIIQGFKDIPDCTFTQYGINAVTDNGDVLTSVVLAAA